MNTIIIPTPEQIPAIQKDCLYQVKIQPGVFKCLKTEQEYTNYKNLPMLVESVGVLLIFGLVIGLVIYIIKQIY